MSRYESRSDLAAKIDWEGGMSSALDYGIRMDDMPEGDYELINAWQIMEICWGTYEKAKDKVMALLPDEYEDRL
jgi:hypothetical protein